MTVGGGTVAGAVSNLVTLFVVGPCAAWCGHLAVAFGCSLCESIIEITHKKSGECVRCHIFIDCSAGRESRSWIPSPIVRLNVVQHFEYCVCVQQL